MTLPAQPVVSIRFDDNTLFTDVLVLGDASKGILGTNILGSEYSSAVDVTELVNTISIRRGRDRVSDHYNNGSATITLIDTTGDFDPSNTSSPYYGQILPQRQLRITARYGGHEYFLFSGYITSWDFEYEKGFDGTFVKITAEDAFRTFNLIQIEEIPTSAPQDLPGTRINDILDVAGWPTSMRNISAGTTELLDDPWTVRTALSAMQTIEDTENGALYMDRAGNIVFKSRLNVAEQLGSTLTVFDDDGTDISYQEIDFSLDDTDLTNDVTVQAEGGDPQQVEDATSIASYFRRSLSRTGLMFYDDNDAYAQAKRILGYRKDVKLRINSVGLECSTESERVFPAITLNLNDPIQVWKTQPGGNRLNAILSIQGIDHDIRPDQWKTKFTTAFPLTTAFILGNTAFGILGTSAL